MLMAVLPPLVGPFLLTLATSFLVGIGLRDYYEGSGKFDTFGTVRTLVFIGMLGFMLYTLPEIGHWAFLVGMVTVVAFLLVYYIDKVGHKKSPGLIGVTIAQLTYVSGPVAIHLTDRLETGEVVTVCKFLAIAAVILPLIPATMPPLEGIGGAILAALPVTPRQIWLAVVITTSISYFGYVLQTYIFPRKGLLLTGLIGGMYSSTAAVLVLAKKSKRLPGRDREAAGAILLAVSMMYLRLLVLVAVFRIQATVQVGPALLVLSALAAGYALWVVKDQPSAAPAEAAGAANGQGGDGAPEQELRNNPLELNAAFLFAVLFVLISIATKYTLAEFKDMGLRVLSFVVGFSDITPFVVSVLQGDLGIGTAQILQAIVIASASNNLMKLVYAYAFGTRATANLAALGMGPLAVLSLLYVAIAF